jgi:hypothetical protein
MLVGTQRRRAAARVDDHPQPCPLRLRPSTSVVRLPARLHGQICAVVASSYGTEDERAEVDRGGGGHDREAGGNVVDEVADGDPDPD